MVQITELGYLGLSISDVEAWKDYRHRSRRHGVAR